MIDDLLNDLKREEGWRSKPYRDHLGFLTIGYGFLIDERKDVELPQSVGDLWLEHVATEKWLEIRDRFPWLAAQPEDVQRAIAQMAYQLGVNGVARFRNMLDSLESGDRQAAAEHALDSTWAKQTPERASRVAALIRGS